MGSIVDVREIHTLSEQLRGQYERLMRSDMSGWTNHEAGMLSQACFMMSDAAKFIQQASLSRIARAGDREGKGDDSLLGWLTVKELRASIGQDMATLESGVSVGAGAIQTGVAATCSKLSKKVMPCLPNAHSRIDLGGCGVFCRVCGIGLVAP